MLKTLRYDMQKRAPAQKHKNFLTLIQHKEKHTYYPWHYIQHIKIFLYLYIFNTYFFVFLCRCYVFVDFTSFHLHKHLHNSCTEIFFCADFCAGTRHCRDFRTSVLYI